MTREEFAARRRDAMRADYVHENRYASLGKAASYRSPLAFYPEADRASVYGEDLPSLAKYLPPAVSLSEAAIILRTFPEV